MNLETEYFTAWKASLGFVTWQASWNEHWIENPSINDIGGVALLSGPGSYRQRWEAKKAIWSQETKMPGL